MDDDVCPYEVLEIEFSATEEEIKKAKKTLSRKYHPDKNRSASETEQTRLRLKFDLIAKAIEFLGDPSEKAKYDNILKARHANKVRHAKQDTERRAARDDLEARERQSQRARAAGVSSAAQREDTLRRLRGEAAERIEQEQLRQKQEEHRRRHAHDQQSYPVKVNWSSKDGYYTEEVLQATFGKYGVLEAVVIARQGRAIVSFHRAADAHQAALRERGTGDHPFKKVEMLTPATGEPEPKLAKPDDHATFAASSTMDLDAMEALLMANLLAN